MFNCFSGQAEAKILERYPLVVAMIDGRVQQACSHPDDDVWSVNMKKGIASAFQNSLPSNSSINSGLNFTEVDSHRLLQSICKIFLNDRISRIKVFTDNKLKITSCEFY